MRTKFIFLSMLLFAAITFVAGSEDPKPPVCTLDATGTCECFGVLDPATNTLIGFRCDVAESSPVIAACVCPSND